MLKVGVRPLSVVKIVFGGKKNVSFNPYVVIFLTGSVLPHKYLCGRTYVVFFDWYGMLSGTLFITPRPSAPQLFFSFLIYEKYLK